jgi:hypothetical protein
MSEPGLEPWAWVAYYSTCPPFYKADIHFGRRNAFAVSRFDCQSEFGESVHTAPIDLNINHAPLAK